MRKDTKGWELFVKTGLVEAYNYYKARENQDASGGKRAGDKGSAL